MVHVLHIGKTGGSAVKYALRRGKPVITGGHIIFTHNHRFVFKDVLPGEKTVFFVRDPIDRFVSGFYSRKHKGLPGPYYEWSGPEKEAFGRFRTPNELAVSLSSKDPGTSGDAVKAMKSISHVNASYWHWFIDEAYFLSRRNDVLFVGAQMDLDRDFARLKKLLNLPREFELPSENAPRNASPADVDRFLDEEAIKNLKNWYSRDLQFMELLKNNGLLRSAARDEFQE
jgi:hypothetical protein